MKLSNVQLRFSRLYHAEEYEKGDGRPRYSATFCIPKGSPLDKTIEDEIKKQATEKLGAKGANWLASVRGQKTQDCYRADPNEPKIMQLSAHRGAKNGPPGVYDNKIDPETGKVREVHEHEGRVYDGCYVNATVDIYLQTEGTNQGVRCSLTAVQFHKDGDAFGGAKRATPDDFQAAEGADAEDLA